MSKHFVDTSGNYLGEFIPHTPRKWIAPVTDEATGEELQPGRWEEGGPVWPEIPDGAVEVETPPHDGRQTWDAAAGAWLPVPPDPLADLVSTEEPATVARKLEEVIEHIETGAPLSSYTVEWFQTRKTARENL